MACSRTFTLLCGLLATTLVGAFLSPPVALILGPEITRERLAQELKDHNAISVLQELPLLSAIGEEPAGGIPILGSLVNSVLNRIIWLKVTSANILQLQVEPSTKDQELMVKIPLDMVAGFNTPLYKSIVEMHMEAEVEATIEVETSKGGNSQLALSSCSTSQKGLRISLLKKLSFMVNPLANNVMKLLVPALPKLVKKQLCPVIEEAFEDMYKDLLHLAKMPVSIGDDHLEFDLQSSAIKGDAIQLNLGAKLLDSQGNVTKKFSESVPSLTVPDLDGAPFSLTVRQDVLNAAIVALLPPEEFMVMLDYVLPELARRLKSKVKVISEKAAEALGRTQIVKILTQEAPKLVLNSGAAQVAQMIVLEVFSNNKVLRPLFTLGIEASSEAQFDPKGDQLKLHLNTISADRVHMMNADIALFDPEILKDLVADILATLLLPNENGKLRHGILLPIIDALGIRESSIFMTKVSG
ncbi:PREDICTED: BPI fold-containing family B member 1 [Miniopterus natalensis]|uniref:BPI fold-containing family B member 1 n=1 Tax=Miniopterus natalensis TaxID=291302 RepID=UPI0007A6C435|nr:PREDICTED: BPI fold-containing family B member 1 [Miniopterus natalensis]